MVQQLLIEAFGLNPDDILVKAVSQGGVDIHLSPLATQVFPFGIEVKNRESLNVWAALKQAERNAFPKGVPPILFFRRSNSPLYVAVTADLFVSLVKQQEHSRSPQAGENI